MIFRFKNNWTIKKVVIIFALVFLVFPHFALAQSSTITSGCDILDESPTYKPITINFNLPGVTKKVVIKDKTVYQVANLQCFIVGIYVYFSGVAGILATVMIMYGGVKYVISMGNPSRMGDAKDTIFSAVVGLVLVLGAYVLLNLINPNITQLKVPGLELANVVKINAETKFCDTYTEDQVKLKEEGADRSCGTTGEIILDDESKSDCIYLNGCADGAICGQSAVGLACVEADQACEYVNTLKGDDVKAEDCMSINNLLNYYESTKSKFCGDIAESRLVRKCRLMDKSFCPDDWTKVDCDSNQGVESQCFGSF